MTTTDRRAVRAENLLLDGPLPVELRDRLQVKVQDLERGWDPENHCEVFRPTDRTLLAALHLRDGRILLPRNAASVAELEGWGYFVEEVEFDVPVYAELSEAAEAIAPRNEQQAAIDALQAGEGFMTLGTGKGKTVVFLKAAAASGEPFLVFVDNGALLQQWQDRISDFLRLPPDRIAICRGPASTWDWEHAFAGLVVTNSFHLQYQAGTLPPEFFQRWGWVCFDEAHVYAADTRKLALSAFSGRRVALTATPEINGYEKIMQLHVGGVRCEQRKPDMFAEVHAHMVVPTRTRAYRAAETAAYVNMMTDCLGGTSRKPDTAYLEKVTALLADARERGRKVLVHCPRLKFAHALLRAFDDAVLLDQTVPSSMRMRVLNASDTVITTPQIGEKALDRSDLDYLLVVFPFGSQAVNRITQAAGRILRLHPDKPTPEMHLVYPDVEYGKKLASSNLRVLAKQGHDIQQDVDDDRRGRMTRKQAARRQQQAAAFGKKGSP